ncbi:hypothetical protein [Burkholderia vietnamiensis]|uniref:Uncharacterized protein n=1 Tax=Burkholderia vietnamiensis TaxID=60552 RepID=A0AAW7T8Z1_BURVI|nr:hypothetical protein [Burkholderia vietnamiensis]MDN7797253.1 hypothetical protein [Burkholderia vietnamiensis]HDR9192149.1 hypothetical protein [Burkholderia vietnamiensis]
MPASPAVWAAEASHLIADCFDHAKPYLDQAYEGLPSLVRFVAAQLFIDCHLSSESSLLLVQLGKEWDADLISRAVMEGSVKLTYMLHGALSDIESKVEEYWHVLPLFSAIRHGEHARQFLDAVPDADAPEWLPFKELLIEPEEVTSIRANYSKRARQEIEERWSFVGICRFFARIEEPGLRHIGHLAHGYSMSSHLIHKDADSIGMIWERSTRDEARRTAASLGHSARVVSDACSFAKLRLLSLLRACGESKKVFNDIDAKYAHLAEELASASKHFNDVEYHGKA